MGIAIWGTGSYVPERVVTNDEVGAPAGVDDAWIHAKTGIRERRWAAPDEATSDMAVAAAARALTDAGVDASDLTHVVVATSTPDHPQPPTAALVQAALGADAAAAFDLNGVCSGFVIALDVAAGLVRDGGLALVVGADCYSRILDPRDRRTVVLFGDGAGAAVVGRGHADQGVIASRSRSFGDLADLIRVPAGGSRLPLRDEHRESGEAFFTMRGRDVREFVTGALPELVRDFLADVGCPPEAVDRLVVHQANGVMIGQMVDAIGLPTATVPLTVERYGNTAAASVAITLDEAARAGDVVAGDLVLLLAYGGGMAASMTLLRW